MAAPCALRDADEEENKTARHAVINGVFVNARSTRSSRMLIFYPRSRKLFCIELDGARV